MSLKYWRSHLLKSIDKGSKSFESLRLAVLFAQKGGEDNLYLALVPDLRLWCLAYPSGRPERGTVCYIVSDVKERRKATQESKKEKGFCQWLSWVFKPQGGKKERKELGQFFESHALFLATRLMHEHHIPRVLSMLDLIDRQISVPRKSRWWFPFRRIWMSGQDAKIVQLFFLNCSNWTNFPKSKQTRFSLFPNQ